MPVVVVPVVVLLVVVPVVVLPVVVVPVVVAAGVVPPEVAGVVVLAAGLERRGRAVLLRVAGFVAGVATVGVVAATAAAG